MNQPRKLESRHNISGYRSSQKVVLAAISAFFLLLSCGEDPLTTVFTLPGSNVLSKVVYVSEHYVENLRTLKSHPAAIRGLPKGESPILFFQESSKKYGKSPNFHEGGGLVEVPVSQDRIEVDGLAYKKVVIQKTIELTLSQIIISSTLSRKSYRGPGFDLKVESDHILLNGARFDFAIDVGGGYNELIQTMIRSKSKTKGFSAFAIAERDENVNLTPLKYDDGPVLVKAGETVVLLGE